MSERRLVIRPRAAGCRCGSLSCGYMSVCIDACGLVTLVLLTIR